MKILMAVDGSAHTRHLVEYLVSHADWAAPTHHYTAVHCVPAVPPGAASMLNSEDLKSYYDEESEKVFGPIRDLLRQKGWQAEFVTKVGNAGDTIAQMAEKGGYELVVMGSHGHTALGKLVLGSVATRVMAQCRVPVLLVR